MEILKRVQWAGENERLTGSTVENISTWLRSEFLPDWAVASIEELVRQSAWEELDDRFYRYLEFGTGGMRGRTIANTPTSQERGELSPQGTPARPAVGSAVLNDFNIVRATIGLYRYCGDQMSEIPLPGEGPKLVIAYDVRHFSRHFCELTASTWIRLGGRAFIFDGPRSTPQLSFSVRHLRAAAGIVITASHNPPWDNGYKVYFSDGGQVVSPHAEGIIREVYRVDLKEITPFLEKRLEGIVTLPASIDDAYLEVLKENVIDPDAIRSTPPKIVYTPIHGTGGVMSIPLMERFGVDLVTVEEQMEMDPRFPTVSSPNPENFEALNLAVARAGEVAADAVLAADPDADRMGVAVRNDKGEMVQLTGNMIGALLIEYRISKLKCMGWLPPESVGSAAIIKTFVTTPLQSAIAHAHGLKVIDTLTGFKFIGEKLKAYEDELLCALSREGGGSADYDCIDHNERRELMLNHSTYFVFGGEESYGYLASDRVRDKDANAAVIMFCELAADLKSQNKSCTEYLDQIYLNHGYFLEQLLNLAYGGASGATSIAKIMDSYRSHPPTVMGPFSVTEFTDFGTDQITDADGHLIPKQDFYFLELDNGYSYAVRGSGTEPKIKFYFFAREDVPEPAALAEAKEKAARTLGELKVAVESDARTRAG